jgi:hypothetical protein
MELGEATSQAERLLCEIARCPVIAEWYASADRRRASPCHHIIDYQARNFGATERRTYQAPEPWRGDLAGALLLFVSSNPSIGDDAPDEYPRWEWSDAATVRYFTRSFEDLIIDGAYTRPIPRLGRSIYVPFWGGVRDRARELMGPAVRPGRDYAITEVVHCKSRQEIGVREASAACARRYLRRVIAAAGARVVVVLGGVARAAVTLELRELGVSPGTQPDWGTVLDLPEIGGRNRLVVFLPHPNAHMCRSFAACVAESDLRRLQAALRP